MSFSDPVLISLYQYLFVCLLACLHVTGSTGKGAWELEDGYYENDVSGPEARGRKFTCHQPCSELRTEVLKLRWDTTAVSQGAREATENPKIVQAAVAAAGC